MFCFFGRSGANGVETGTGFLFARTSASRHCRRDLTECHTLTGGSRAQGQSIGCCRIDAAEPPRPPPQDKASFTMLRQGIIAGNDVVACQVLIRVTRILRLGRFGARRL